MLCVRAPLRGGMEKEPGLILVLGKSLILSFAGRERTAPCGLLGLSTSPQQGPEGATDALCIPKKIGLSSLLS